MDHWRSIAMKADVRHFIYQYLVVFGQSISFPVACS